MRVLIDTNVLMDYLTKREPYFESALKVVTACMLKKANGYLAAHSILNLFFILRHDYTNEQRRVMLQNMCVLFQIVEIDREILLAALADKSFPDFEDGVQARCAEACQADYIITRNERDFVSSAVPAIHPDVFCKQFD